MLRHLRRRWPWRGQGAGLTFVHCYSGKPSDESTVTVKAALRSLYKQVHPDLFSEHPPQKAANERSFKLLQEYLNLARDTSAHAGPASKVTYRFEFYLRQQQQQQQQGQEQGQQQGQQQGQEGAEQQASPASPADDFRRVELTLPPPAPDPGQGLLSATVRKALGRLLAACGMRHDLQDDAPSDSAVAKRLSLFVPDAAEQLRQHEASGVKLEVRLANIRGAMRVARGVVAGFGGPDASRPPPAQQLALLRDLAAALEHVEQDLCGCHVLLGERTGLDARGTLWLDCSDPDGWLDFLNGVDVEFALGRRDTVRALGQLERAVAAAAGVAQLFTSPAAQMDPGYRAFLERLAALAAERGEVAGGALGAVSLQVGPPAQPAGASSAAGSGASGPWAGFSWALQPGCLLAPLDAPAADVYAFLAARGPAAARALQAAQAEDAEVQQLAVQVRTGLRLRHLVQGSGVDVQQFRQCCRELAANTQALLPLLEGLSVCISDRNGLWLDKGMILVAWDFDL